MAGLPGGFNGANIAKERNMNGTADSHHATIAT
jgi:hypothetical protein